MREILFRGKRADNGEWVYGDLIHDRLTYSQKDVWWIWNVDMEDIGNVDVFIPETISEFTGLTDKNGTKIFEGDIVEWRDEIGVVEYFESDAMFIVSYDGWYDNFGVFLSSDFEVIGNIHDNPELLEG